MSYKDSLIFKIKKFINIKTISLDKIVYIIYNVIVQKMDSTILYKALLMEPNNMRQVMLIFNPNL